MNAEEQCSLWNFIDCQEGSFNEVLQKVETAYQRFLVEREAYNKRSLCSIEKPGILEFANAVGFRSYVMCAWEKGQLVRFKNERGYGLVSGWNFDSRTVMVKMADGDIRNFFAEYLEAADVPQDIVALVRQSILADAEPMEAENS